MIYTGWQDYDRVASILKVSKPAGVPLLVDAADGLPPFEKFMGYAKLGVDLYDFSGGKGLCGPQASGVLLGRKDLITAAKFNSDPWEGGICRHHEVRQGRDRGTDCGNWTGGRMRTLRRLIRSGRAEWSALQNWLRRYRE